MIYAVAPWQGLQRLPVAESDLVLLTGGGCRRKPTYGFTKQGVNKNGFSGKPGCQPEESFQSQCSVADLEIRKFTVAVTVIGNKDK